MLGSQAKTIAAQEATIVGTVTDPSGAVIANVDLRIANEKTGSTRSLITNSVGQYVAADLPIGTYDLKTESPGFKVMESKGVVPNVNDRIRVDFQMELGPRSETATVESAAVSVQAESGEQSLLISGTQMSELSTNGRSIYTYITLTTGSANLIPAFQPPAADAANANVVFNGKAAPISTA